MKIIASELTDLLVSWQLKLRAENKSPRTLRAYRDGVNQFLRWCDDTGTPPVLTKVAAQGFLSSLLRQRCRVEHCARQILCAEAFFKVAGERGGDTGRPAGRAWRAIAGHQSR